MISRENLVKRNMSTCTFRAAITLVKQQLIDRRRQLIVDLERKYMDVVYRVLQQKATIQLQIDEQFNLVMQHIDTTSEFHQFFRFRNDRKVLLERPLLPFRTSFFLIYRERSIFCTDQLGKPAYMQYTDLESQ